VVGPTVGSAGIKHCSPPIMDLWAVNLDSRFAMKLSKNGIKIPTRNYSSFVAAATLHLLICLGVRRGMTKLKP